MIIGIDVSTWQGKIDWNQVKNSDVKFAILRSSFGSPDPSQVDNQFENNYKGAKAAGIPVGAYHYGYAVSEAEARQEARFFLDTIQGQAIRISRLLRRGGQWNDGHAFPADFDQCN